MFFEDAPSKKEIYKSVNTDLIKMVDQNFKEMRNEMITELVKLGVPEEEYDEYIRHLYLQVQAAVIKEFKKDLQDRLGEMKNQAEHGEISP